MAHAQGHVSATTRVAMKGPGGTLAYFRAKGYRHKRRPWPRSSSSRPSLSRRRRMARYFARGLEHCIGLPAWERQREDILDSSRCGGIVGYPEVSGNAFPVSDRPKIRGRERSVPVPTSPFPEESLLAPLVSRTFTVPMDVSIIINDCQLVHAS